MTNITTIEESILGYLLFAIIIFIIFHAWFGNAMRNF
jgi:hypothetical protein